MVTQNIRQLILHKYQSDTAKTSDIIKYILSHNPDVPPATINWVLYNMVKNKEVVRAGRGIYSFDTKPIWQPALSVFGKNMVSIMSAQLPYLQATITDSSVLREFMVQQPFSFSVIVEVPNRLIDSVVQKLNDAGIKAFSKANQGLAELYVKDDTSVFVTKTVQTTALLPCEGRISTSRLEKILVDALAEPELYAQFQGWELENIYENASEAYALNYSQMLKYATNRGKRPAAEELLKGSKSYQKYLEAAL